MLVLPQESLHPLCPWEHVVPSQRLASCKHAAWVTPPHLRSPARSSRGLTETGHVKGLGEFSRSGQTHVASLFISHEHFAFSVLKDSSNGSKCPDILLPQSHLQAQTRTGAPFWATGHLLPCSCWKSKAQREEGSTCVWPLSMEMGPPQPWVPTHLPLQPPSPAGRCGHRKCLRAMLAPEQGWVDSGGSLGVKTHLRIGFSAAFGTCV